MRATATDSEQTLWWHLRHRLDMPFTQFRRQVRLGRYFADFASHRAKIIIEVDGSQHQQQDADDLRRTEFFRSRGYRVLRDRDNDVLTDIDPVLEDIRRATTTTPTPDPSPQGGGEKSFAPVVTVILALVAFALIAFAPPASAQSYPTKPITLVIPLPPGGSNDIMARAIADKMSAGLGQQVVVENRASGGSGTVATRAVAHGPADGYTILLGYTSTLATGPYLAASVGYDVRKDFAPLGLIASAPALLLTHPSVTAKNVTELIAMMRASPEPYQVGTPGVTTVNHLAAVLFAQQAGVKLQYIPYKGSQPLITDLIGGHVKVGFNPIPVSRAALEGKLIRALAGTSLKRSTMFPDLPTVAESGLPGFDAVLTYGLLAPAGTPKPIVERLNKELRAALATPEVQQRLHQEGAEPMPTTPEQHAKVIDQEDIKWSAIIKSAGMKAK